MATLDNLKPANYDITYYANDEFDLSIEVKDADGVAVDLSGDTITMTIKKKKSSAAVYTLSTASEITISGASNSILTFSGNYDLKEMGYYYDLYNNTDEVTIMYGNFIVTEEVHD
jgi:hypothetical protein